MSYLTENQVTAIAETALASFEMSASWKAARAAGIEFARDEFGVNPNGAQIATAISKAKIGWTAITYATKKELGA